MNKGKTRIDNALRIYKRIWQNQEMIFKKIEEPNPYPDPRVIDLKTLSANEKQIISNLTDLAEEEIFRKVSEIFIKYFGIVHKQRTDMAEAKNKLGISFVNNIPRNRCKTLSSFYNSIPGGITRPHLKDRELDWMYKNGYLPHLYWNGGNPLFDSRMWFIVDLTLRTAREETGLGIEKSLLDWSPKWWQLSNYLKLVIFMYNSWNLGEKIFDYSDHKLRKVGLTGKELKITRRGLTRDLWINEGKCLALDLLDQTNLNSGPINLLNYYRDLFALLSFEASPANHIIDLYSQKSQRISVMFSYEEFIQINTSVYGSHNINTHTQVRLSDQYSLLFSAIDWALSMSEGVKNRKVVDIVEKYRHNSFYEKGKIPCRICGELFVPRRPSIDVTCGKRRCIEQNKYLRKTKKTELIYDPIKIK